MKEYNFIDKTLQSESGVMPKLDAIPCSGTVFRYMTLDEWVEWKERYRKECDEISEKLNLELL